MSLYLLAESYLHRLDPVALPISPSWGIRWYGLAYLAGFIIAWVSIRWMARTGRSIIPAAAVGDLLVYCVVGVLVGGRLGYALFYNPDLFLSFSPSPPWWELLAIHRGGMASHGGIAGVIIAMVIFAHRHRLPAWHLIDLAALCAPPGLFLGRLANFVNGELWGKPLAASMQTDPPWWSVKYPEEVFVGEVDLTEIEGAVGGTATLAKTVVERLHAGDASVMDVVVPQLTAWWPSQLIQAIADGPILLAVLVCVWWKPRRPGVVSAWFLLAYGTLRILTEVVRQPDDGVVLILGLQRGQLLSVGMVLVGAYVLWWVTRRSISSIGGLRGHPGTG